jgi:hypothetical protein
VLHFQISVHDLPPEETELISAAVGQAQLLLRIKLIQFRDLINIYETSLAGETEKPVTFLDLQVFWDMSKNTHHTQSVMCVLGHIVTW